MERNAIATIHAYAAVNCNTKRAEDAYTVIDLLLREYAQQHYQLYTDLILSMEISLGYIPMQEDLMQAEKPIFGILGLNSSDGWSMSEENFAEFCEIRDHIASARFESSLSWDLELLLMKCIEAKKQGGNYTELVHECYREMTRKIRE